MPSKYARKSGNVRSRKIIICCEGEVTEPNYFNELVQYLSLTQAEVEIIDKEAGYSSPEQVLNSINGVKSNLRKMDRLLGIEEFWLVMDVDRWGIQLTNVVNTCFQQNYIPTVSNPCFEIWLLAHHYNDAYIIANANLLTSKIQINTVLHNKHLHGKRDVDYFQHTDYAIDIAKRLDIVPSNRWPQTIGTHVYRLVIELKSMQR